MTGSDKTCHTISKGKSSRFPRYPPSMMKIDTMAFLDLNNHVESVIESFSLV